MLKRIEQIDQEDCCKRWGRASGTRYIDSVIVTQLVNSFVLRRTHDVMPRSSAHESRSTYAGCVEKEHASPVLLSCRYTYASNTRYS